MPRQVGLAAPLAPPAALLRRRFGENFSVASAWVPRRERRLLMAIYAYARFVDEIGDGGRPDADALLDAIERDVRSGGTGPPELPVLQPVLAALADARLPREPLLQLVEANRRDQVVHRYATFDDLLDYCRLSAEPVGRLVLEVMGSSNPVTRPLSDAVCSALQVVEHLQDVREDAVAGRIYLPTADLERSGVTESELVESCTASPALCEVIALCAARARSMLVSGSPLVGLLRGWRRAAVAGYIAGGLCGISALEAAGYDVIGARPRPRRTARAAVTASLTMRGRAR